MGESSDANPFLVIPATDEYFALSFLVRNPGESVTPTEIADHTNVSEATASETMTRLFERQLVQRTQETYYIDPDRVTEIRRRLKSVDAASRLHEATPEDDLYSMEGWEEEMGSL